MSTKTRIALLLAVAIAPASALAAAKHPAHQADQQSPATAYAHDSQTPPTSQETYIWLQDQSIDRN